MSIYTEIHPVKQERGKAAVVLVHGAGDHSARYGHVIAALQADGYPVVTGDLPGHGRTAGLAGHVEAFDDYLDTVERWIAQAAALTASGRVALIGHSMGGLVVLRFLQERAARHPEVAAAVVTSPCLRLAMEIPRWKEWLGRQLANLTPRLRMPSGIDPAILSRTPQVVAAYADDPYCGGKVSVRWYEELRHAMEQARARAGLVERPLLLMQGGQDRLTDPRAAAQFYQDLPPRAEHRWLKYPACYHELFNEPEQQQIFSEMIEWLDRQTTSV